ncbi:hypothetical protein ACNO5E_14110 [Vibrio parahaemolyticus]
MSIWLNSDEILGKQLMVYFCDVCSICHDDESLSVSLTDTPTRSVSSKPTE